MRKVFVNITLALFSLLLLLSSCTTTRMAVLIPEENEEIELFTTKVPERNYVEICYIQTDGGIFTTPQKLLDELKKKGIALEADALIDIKYDFQAWYPVASGIAIVYTN